MTHSLHLLFSSVAADDCLPYLAADDCVVLMRGVEPERLAALQQKAREVWLIDAASVERHGADLPRVDYAELVRMTGAAGRVISWP